MAIINTKPRTRSVTADLPKGQARSQPQPSWRVGAVHLFAGITAAVGHLSRLPSRGDFPSTVRGFARRGGSEIPSQAASAGNSPSEYMRLLRSPSRPSFQACSIRLPVSRNSGRSCIFCRTSGVTEGIAPANPMVDVSGVCAGRLLCQFCGVGGRGEFGQ